MQYKTICGEHFKFAHIVSFYQGTESERIHHIIVGSLYTLQDILQVYTNAISVVYNTGSR